MNAQREFEKVKIPGNISKIEIYPNGAHDESPMPFVNIKDKQGKNISFYISDEITKKTLFYYLDKCLED